MKKLKKLLLGAIASLTLASCDLSSMMGGGFSFPGLDGLTSSIDKDVAESYIENMEGDLEEKLYQEFMEFCRYNGEWSLFDWLMHGNDFVKMYVESLEKAATDIKVTFNNGEVTTLHNWRIYAVREWPTCSYGGNAVLECIDCGSLTKLELPSNGQHELNPAYDIVSPTCETGGVQMWKCNWCGTQEERPLEAYGHDWNYDSLPCGFTGTTYTNCWRCGENRNIVIDAPTEHKGWDQYDWTPGENPGDGWTRVDSNEARCPYDQARRVSWGIDQVTPNCMEPKEIDYKSEKDGGFHSAVEPNTTWRRGFEFYGRPVGNAIELGEDGYKIGNKDVPSQSIEGSFIEYRVRIKNSMNNVKLRTFLSPDENVDVTDIWKTLGDMRGYDFNSIEAISSGKGYQTITDFNVLLYIDGIKIDFDRNINTPVRIDHRYGEHENWYSFPMEGINLSAGYHTIKLVQAAGVRHSFHEFVLEEASGTNSGGYINSNPINLEEVFFEEGVGADAGKTFVYIGGDLKVDEQLFISACDPFFELQVNGNRDCMGYQSGNGSWRSYRLDTTPGLVSCVVRNGKGYVKADITSIPSGGYVTHLNFVEKIAMDCYMDVCLNTTTEPVIIGDKQYSAWADPFASSEDYIRYWGSLAIIVGPIGQVIDQVEFTTTNGYQEAGEPLGGHIISADNVYGTSGGRKIVCSHCNGLQGYEFKAQDALRGQTNPSETGTDSVAKNTRLGKNNIFEDVWSIQDLDRGTYQVYLKARCSVGNSNAGYWYSPASIAQGSTITNNGTTEEAQTSYKYKIAVTNGDSDANSNWTGIGNEIDNYAATGINEYTPEWTNKVMATVTFGEGDNTLTLRNTGSGYTIWVYSLCLIKIA